LLNDGPQILYTPVSGLEV